VIEKRSARNPARAAVTFRVPAEAGARSACLAGEFNGWSTSATPMHAHDGGFSTVLELDRGRTYRFRYYLDSERWENDWAADGYAPNEFGGDDSVIDLTGAADE
jgi:1,4-alpha-glucan branching enzyme